MFDQSGLISSDCSDDYSEILVGSGVYDGNQITISGFGSIDFCDFENGYQLPGWIGGHNISIKIWDASSNTEFIPEVNYIVGSGEWGDIFSVIDQLIVNELSVGLDNNFNLFLPNISSGDDKLILIELISCACIVFCVFFISIFIQMKLLIPTHLTHAIKH